MFLTGDESSRGSRAFVSRKGGLKTYRERDCRVLFSSSLWGSTGF